MAQDVIIAGPAKLYLATTVDATEPALDADPPDGTYSEFGQSYWSTGGITVAQEETYVRERVDSSPYIQRAFLSEAGMTVSGNVKDISLETLRIFYNQATITTTAADTGKLGNRSMTLAQGRTPQEYTLVVRFMTPYGDVTDPAFAAQLWIPRAFRAGGFSFTLSRGAAAVPNFSLEVLESTSNGVGKLLFADADAKTQ